MMPEQSTTPELVGLMRGEVTIGDAAVGTWDDGLCVRATNYPEADMDEARAAAERVAEERG
jgi:hypothetical protein